MKKAAVKVKIGDKVRIPHYSNLYGLHQNDPAIDRQMAKVVYRVIAVNKDIYARGMDIVAKHLCWQSRTRINNLSAGIVRFPTE